MPEPLRHKPPSKEIMEIAVQLDAIGQWQMDSVAAQTKTGKLLCRAAEWLKATARNTCGQRYVGCRGGDDCTSSHK